MQATAKRHILALSAVLGFFQVLNAQITYAVVDTASSPGVTHVVRHGTDVLGIDGSGATYLWDAINLTWSSTGATSLGSFPTSGARFVTRGNTAVAWSGSLAVLKQWNGSQWTTPSYTNTPTAIGGFMLAGTPNGDVVLFGGDDGNVELDETWVLDSFNVWTNPNPANKPSARSFVAMGSNGASTVVLYGGVASSVYLDDTWEFNGANWSQTASNGPMSARCLSGLCYQPTDDKMVLIGGVDAGGAASDAWTYTGGTWTQITASYTPNTGGIVSAALAVTEEVVTIDPTAGTVILAQNAGYRVLGAGCNCDLQTNPFGIGATSTPLIGTTFTLTFANYAVGNVLFVIADTAPASPSGQFPLLPTGCLLHTATTTNASVVSLTSPTAPAPTFPFSVPNNTALIGVHLYFQGAQLPFTIGGSTYLGCSSNGLDVLLGR